jgi:adenylate kinase
MSARLVLLGPPGAGKGTQAVRLAERLGVPAISTGDIFRTNVSEGTDLGRLAQEYMNAGSLVPDEVTNAMVRHRLAEADAIGGFLLDGYPRNVAQAGELADTLNATGVALDAVVEITADVDEVVTRLLHRAEIEGRADDTEPVIRHRMTVYREQTAPLAAFYQVRGILVQVDGMGSVDEVTDRLVGALAARIR